MKHIKIIGVIIALLFPIVCAQAQDFPSEAQKQEWIRTSNFDEIDQCCRQCLTRSILFYLWGELSVEPITNVSAHIYDILKFGAEQGNPNCQFMFACILSGNKTIRRFDDNYDEKIIPTPSTYKYLDDEKAKYYFKAYFKNPKMDKESGAFAQTSFDLMKKLVQNAYPDLPYQL